MATVGIVAKDACLIGLLVDALLPGKDKPLWPITWDQLAPLQQWSLSLPQQTTNVAKSNGLDDNHLTNYNQERLLLLLSLLVTASNYEKDEFIAPAWLTAHALQYNTCPAVLVKPEKQQTIASPGTLGYFFHQPDRRRGFVVFSGTANGCMSMIDMDYIQVPYSELSNYQEGVLGHRGFYLAYLSVRTQLLQLLRDYQNQGQLQELIICGHSLGGGMATVAVFDLARLSPYHYSFAGPRVLNTAGAQLFNKLVPHSLRIVNEGDIVPTMPMAVMPNGNSFDHTHGVKNFLHNMGNYSDNHSLAYLLHYQLVTIDHDD